MRPAELFFRLGSALVGWIVVYAYLLMVAVIPRSSCSLTNDGLWLPTLYMAVLVAVCVPLMQLGTFLRESLRWLAAPLVLLWPLALLAVLPYVNEATVDGKHVCAVLNPSFAPDSQPGWHRLWAPAQLLALAAVAWSVWRYWRTPASAR